MREAVAAGQPRGTASPWLAAAVLGYLVGDVARQGPILRLESRYAQVPRPGRVWPVWVSASSETPVLALVVAGGALWDRTTGRRPAARTLSVLALVAGRAALSRAVKRPRPPRQWWLETPLGWSFPSRHTMNAVVIATLLFGAAGGRGTPAAGTSLAFGWGAATGAGRILLGVHWPSDVLGALLLAALWRHVWTGLEALEPRPGRWIGAGAGPGGEPHSGVSVKTTTERWAS